MKIVDFLFDSHYANSYGHMKQQKITGGNNNIRRMESRRTP